MTTHAVLGAQGAVGAATVEAIQQAGLTAKALTSRDADVRNTKQLIRALEGVDIVYNCVGIPYDSVAWENTYPIMSRALVRACQKNGTKLVYLDNAYLYGPAPLPIPFDETTSRKTTTRKGIARRAGVEIFMDAHSRGKLQVTIGRAADFYGPGALNSLFYISFLEKMLKGQKPVTTVPKNHRHTYAFTEDIARALVTLGTTDDAYGEEFHLPVGPAVTVGEMAAHFNSSLGTNLKPLHLPAIAFRLLSYFNPLLSEMQEMSYQFETDYVMDDTKYRQRFPDFISTSYETGVSKMVDYFRSRISSD